jgi:Spy/CpxP family protein refolding chaperone
MAGAIVGELRSAETQSRHRRVSREMVATIVLLLVAGAGVAAGIAIDRTRLRPFPSYGAAMGLASPTKSERQAMAEQLARELDLTPAQQAQVDVIIARQISAADSLRQEYQPRVRALMLGTRSAIDSILTPAQRERLRAMTHRRDQT